ncbi:MAG TPA: patatin-like phospholipase family protein [Burkholderiales bacterium]
MSCKLLALALQGGGSHGAYTWGVLDRLLENGQIEIEAISGASAGAMNAAVLAYGYLRGGREGAREALATFWNAVSAKLSYNGLGAGATPTLPEPATKAYLSLARYFSPYQLNPLNINPLRDILTEQIDFDRLRAEPGIKLFISATRVRDGALKIFRNDELTLDALLASACIPSLHHTVAVEGESYWDGGLSANPPLSVLVYECDAPDVLVVVLNPSGMSEIPSTADAIFERFTQVSFSSTFFTELQSIGLAKAQAARSRFALGRVDRRLKRLNLQIIDSGATIGALDPATRLKTETRFITRLRDEGRKRAEAWLVERGVRPLQPAPTGMQGGFDASRESECAPG